MHWLVNTKRRFERISIRFPIRGHSYLECDRDMALIKQSTDLDLSNQFVQVFRNARVKPSPFTVIPCDQNMFKEFKDFLKPGYKTSCLFKTRPLREVYIEASHPQYISFRNSWKGIIETAVVTLRPKGKQTTNPLKTRPIECLYTAPIPISREKFKDLQCLKKLCNPENQEFYNNLPVVEPSDCEDGSSTDTSYYADN